MDRAEYEPMKAGIYRAITVTPRGRLGRIDWAEAENAARSLGRDTGRARWALIVDALEEMQERDEGTIWAPSLLMRARAFRESYGRAA